MTVRPKDEEGLGAPPTPANALASPVRFRVAQYLRVGGVFVALFIIGVAISFGSPFFATPRNLLNILLQASTVSIVAAGLTVILIAGEIDLSIGSVEALTGSVAAIFVISYGLPVPLGIILALAVGLLVGSINGYFTVFAKVPSFIVTLAMLGIAQGTAFLLTGGRPVAGFPDTYSWIGVGKLGPIPIPVVVAAIVYAFLHVLLTKTRFGIHVYAVGGGRLAASSVGIPTGQVIMKVFALSGLLAGVAGVVLSSRLGAGSGNFGTGDLLDAVAAAVIGGTSLIGGVGTVVGTIGGALIIATIRNGLVLMNVEAFWQQIVVGTIILIAVLIDQATKGRLSPSDLVPRLRMR